VFSLCSVTISNLLSSGPPSLPHFPMGSLFTKKKQSYSQKRRVVPMNHSPYSHIGFIWDSCELPTTIAMCILWALWALLWAPYSQKKNPGSLGSQWVSFVSNVTAASNKISHKIDKSKVVKPERQGRK